jgi:hypothetical protein
MRHDERDPVPRGNILLASGFSVDPETARPSANPAPATGDAQVPTDHENSAPTSESVPGEDKAGDPGRTGQAGEPGRPAETVEPGQAGGASSARSTSPGPNGVTITQSPSPTTNTPGNESTAAGRSAAAGPPGSGESGSVAAPGPAPAGPPVDPNDASSGTLGSPSGVTAETDSASGTDSATGTDSAVPGLAAPATSSPGPATESPRRAAAAPTREPSWAKVLGTTISLWASRRLGRPVGAAGGTTAPAGRRSGIRWPLVAFVLVLVILALAGLQLSGALSQHSKGQSTTGTGGQTGSGGALSAAEATRAHAATWIAQQVTASDLIACDPLTCSTLESDGVAASRLMSIQPTATDPLGADVVVATASVRSQFGSQLVSEYAPELIASFGTGASRVDVRAVANFGAAAFEAKERTDLIARKSAGAQLLRNGFHVGDQGAGQIQSGQVDSRLLVTLAALLSQRTVDVSSFGDTGPGAPVLYRQVTIVDAPGQTGIAALTADLSQAQAQSKPYLPANAELVHLANGQSALRIEFGAPDQPGLLSGGNS